MKRIRDRVAVVTGAGSGIGRATVGLLARQGCSQALVDIDVARGILRGIEGRKLRVIVGAEAYVLEWMKRLMPVWTHTLIAKRLDPTG